VCLTGERRAEAVRPAPRTSVPRVWHPVGALPARVYWRRRLLVLALLLAVLGGGTWLGITLLSGRGDASEAATATSDRSSTRGAALDRVVPSPARIATPTPVDVPLAAEGAAAAATAPVGPVAGGPCTDEMLGLEVRAPATAAVASKPTFELVVGNVSAVPCVRTLDKGVQEIVLFDGAGTRVWGSNDCFPEASSDSRTLAPGEQVTFPVVWGGLTSEPTCTAPRAAPAPGAYLLRGRLDTKVSPDLPFALA